MANVYYNEKLKQFLSDYIYQECNINVAEDEINTETEDVFANKNTKESRRLLEINLLGSELRQQNANV